MNLTGKSREDVVRMLRTKTRCELIEMIVSLVQVEQHFTATEIACRSGMTKRTVLGDIHAGKFGGEYCKRAANQITVSASGVNAWRRSFCVRVGHPETTDSAGGKCATE
jgi:hypothetical protein